MTRVYKKHRPDTSGEVAQYIPGLGMAYTDVFGMAMATGNKGLVCWQKNKSTPVSGKEIGE